MTRAARLWTSCLLATSFCLPLLAGSTDTGTVGDPGPIAEEGAPYSNLDPYRQYRRDRMSPTDMPSATGSAEHPSQYGPHRYDPGMGIRKHAYSPFDPIITTQSHCPSNGCDYAPNAVLVKFKPEVSVAAPVKSGKQQSVAISLNEPGVFSEPALAQILWDQGFDEFEPLFPGATRPVAGAMATRPVGVQVNLPDLTRWYRVKTSPVPQAHGASDATSTPAPLNIPALIKELDNTPGVELAEPDYIRKPIGQPITTATAFDSEVNSTTEGEMNFSDPLFGKQWHLSSANLKKAWHFLEQDAGKPAGGSPDVVVAVIDTGIDYTHPDLAANMWVNPGEFNRSPGVDDDGNGYVDDIHGSSTVAGALSGNPMDDHGHGTHVAGIIAAQGGNKEGGVGVAPGVKLMAIKSAQYSGIMSASDIARGIYYAVEMGADVINMSFGGYGRSQAEEDALATAFSTAVLVAAAGNSSRYNEGIDPYTQLPCFMGANMYPGAYNWVLGVMARNSFADQYGNNLAGFSNMDCAAEDYSEYELMAPGAHIWSTLPFQGYGAWSGTSMAAPVVSGIAALARTLWSDKNSYSSRFIMGQIAATAPWVQAFTPLGREPVFYRSADALTTLTTAPQPKLTYLEHWLFDTKEIGATNDNDGIVDAGETVELAIVIRNHWGKADNVRVKLDAQAYGAAGPDPYIEMLVDTVNYGAVGSFNNDDNGLIYDAEGVIVGVQEPFRFRTSVTTPNDHVIPFRVTFTADNGLDPAAAGYEKEVWFNLVVQRGKELPRFITTDLTLTKDNLWLVPDSTLIAEGVKVTVTEGTQIQFFSVDPSDPYSDEMKPKIQVEGELLILGTADEPVEIFPSFLYGPYPIVITEANKGRVSIQYAKIANPVIGSADIYSGGTATKPLELIDHVYFTQDAQDCILGYHPGPWAWCNQPPAVSALEIKSTIFHSMGHPGGSLTLNYDQLSDALFDNSFAFLKDTSYDSVFLKNYKKYIDAYGLHYLTSSMSGIPGMHEPSAFRIAFPTVYNGNTYAAISRPVNIGDDRYMLATEAFAKYLGGHVVTVNDKLENNFLVDYRNSLTESTFLENYSEMDCGTLAYGGPTNCWSLFQRFFQLGLVDRFSIGDFNWLSGEPITYTDWELISSPGKYTVLVPSGNHTWWMENGIWNPIVVEIPGVLDEDRMVSGREEFLSQGLYAGFHNNAILNDWWDPNLSRWLRFSMDANSKREHTASLSSNYWHTTSTKLIDKAIYDNNDDFNLGKIEYLPILTTPPETAYPFVADITLTTNGAITDVVGVEPVTFIVTFNRDMNMDVQPFVTFGPAEPYTDFTIPGDWVDSRTWSGHFDITLITGDGMQSIRVIGAEAADDPWLVTGNDYGRFRFEILTSGTEAMSLQATGGEGYVELFWTQNDFDILAGYNLYRSTNPTSGFSRINDTVIPIGMSSWLDSEVLPGTAYFYYFTVVKTDLGESEASNTATATPTDTIPPVISHTPVTSASPGQPLTLTATVTDNVAVQSVTLFHRPLGGSSYASRSMTKTTGDRYTATLEGSLMTAPGIEYFLEASDGISLARSARADLPWQVVIQDKPTLTSVTPVSGTTAGGTSVTLTGTNFKAGITVTFGGAACGSVVRVSSTQVTCVTPAHFPETVDVQVTNPDTQIATLVRGFTFTSTAASLGVPNASGGQNQIITLPINAANVQGLASASLTLSYDPAVLTIQGATTGSLIPGWTLVSNAATAGQARLSMSSSGGTVTGAGILANVEFKVIGGPGSTSSLTLSAVSLNDGAIPAETSSGTFTVDQVYAIRGTVSYWNANRPVPGIDLLLTGNRLYRGTSGLDGTYTVSHVPAGNYTLAPSDASATGGISAYDASLALRHDAGLASLSGRALQAADVNQNGAVTSHDAFYMLQRAVGLIDLPFQGAGKVWLFDPAERTYNTLNTDQTGQDFTAILLGDPSGNWSGQAEPQANSASPAMEASGVAATTSSANLTFPQLPIAAGQQVVVPLTLTLVGGGVQAADLEIQYDPAVVSVIATEKGDLPTDWLLATNHQATPGVIMCSLAGATPVSAPDGRVFVRVTFLAKGSVGTKSDIALPGGALDEGTLASTVRTGVLAVGETFKGNDLELGGTVESLATYEASGTITSGPGLTLGAPSNVTMRAGERVVFKPGFKAKAGARLAVSIDHRLNP